MSTSAISGHIVPKNTTRVATTSSRLFATSPLSRLTGAKTLLERRTGARQAKSVSEPPMKAPRIQSRNTPRSGSVAKACTLVMMPERTTKAPIRLNEKARIASRMVQVFRVSRFSTTMAECSRAAASSQGMKLTFSTGSQNHQPPQPSS